jgi:adenylate cyclase
MNDAELRKSLGRIQDLICADTGARLGITAEESLAQILRNVASHNLSGAVGFSSHETTILMADLRGFTSLSASQSPGTVLKLLNRCLITMSEVVFKHQGTIDKFMGDSIMVLFNAPTSPEDNVQRALLCAMDLQIGMDELNAHYQQLGLPELYLGIGINTGPVMAGTLGSSLYAAYTVIGDDVNLAARIEAFSLRGQVLISDSTYRRCRDIVETGEPIDVHVKGKTEAVRLREVLSMPSFGKSLPRREVRRSHRVKVNMPFSYQLMENKIVRPDVYRGMILDIGYRGLLAQLDRTLEPLSELKLDLDLALIGYRAADVCARITKTQSSEEGSLSGMEFTSLTSQDSQSIQRFVQLLIQGSESK